MPASRVLLLLAAVHWTAALLPGTWSSTQDACSSVVSDAQDGFVGTTSSGDVCLVPPEGGRAFVDGINCRSLGGRRDSIAEELLRTRQELHQLRAQRELSASANQRALCEANISSPLTVAQVLDAERAVCVTAFEVDGELLLAVGSAEIDHPSTIYAWRQTPSGSLDGPEYSFQPLQKDTLGRVLEFEHFTVPAVAETSSTLASSSDFLAAAVFDDVPTVVLRWQPGTRRFEPFQTLEGTTFTRDVEVFEMGGRVFVACGLRLTNILPVFVWDASQQRFVPYQQLVNATKDVLTVAHVAANVSDGHLDLLVTSAAALDTSSGKKHEWVVFVHDPVEAKFVEFQRLPSTAPAHAMSFVIESRLFLACANNADNNREVRANSSLYEWSEVERKFLLHQEFEASAPNEFEFFSINRQHFLAVAQFRVGMPLHNQAYSLILRWHAAQQRFEPFLTVPSSGAHGWAHFEQNQTHYLILANFRDAFGPMDYASVVFKWNTDCDGDGNLDNYGGRP